MHLLLVEDSELLRQRVAAAIGGIEGIAQVSEASDVREALAQLERVRPDVVIFDVQLPDGSGLDLLKVIKVARPATVVMVFTICGSPLYRQRARECGAEYFFSKANDFGKLMQLLGRLADERMRLRSSEPDPQREAPRVPAV